MHKACHSALAELMIMNVLGKNSKETALMFLSFDQTSAFFVLCLTD